VSTLCRGCVESVSSLWPGVCPDNYCGLHPGEIWRGGIWVKCIESNRWVCISDVDIMSTCNVRCYVWVYWTHLVWILCADEMGGKEVILLSKGCQNACTVVPVYLQNHEGGSS
jgi:hypothetical protein